MKKNIFTLAIITLLALTSAAQEADDISLQENTIKLTCEEARFVRLLNIYRKSRGLNKLAVSRSGVVSSRWHAKDMIRKNYFSHTEPTGRPFNDRADSFGYPAHSENIAAGNSDAGKTFCQWKLSPGHNKNMLGTRHETIGIGVAYGKVKYNYFWNNNFGPYVSDTISDSVVEATCAMPKALPVCKKKS